MSYLYIFIGGGLGSLTRFLMGKGASHFVRTDFPIGTFLSNILACIILAILVLIFENKSSHYSWIQPLLIIGFCGGFSTFSSFGNDTVQLMHSGNHFLAIMNVVISIGTGIALMYFISLRSQ